MEEKKKLLVSIIANHAFGANAPVGETKIHSLIRHLARMAAENDYKKLQKTGKIPYSSPKQKENDYE
ncbi:MAG: hypothetical protein Q9M33_12300 [Robiginitomaculum sp.]|nr:hypothetical protein [Robiginitomaculum sp.]